ncbi:hypothetical protein C1752_06196 [Acaryochloris thomasi RCC1774]|uniref:Putative DNA-binding domain-containing protein n=1 Tax=Acaryochloris thomasi RCC1774 TaxID=1764569 RepID=A0A2W1JCN9_9CYAN|nr:DNA-binding domain-containing protein [Acaryochloris thomasi]PZD71576.1 hypothetical protein C1752_06196 [Acaryochloris thomasi RCC1774]
MSTPPPELRELQRLFYSAIATKDSDSIQQLKPQMRSTEHLSFERGLSAYQGSVVGKLSRALEDIYPVCGRLVGTQFFTTMARQYIRRYPSQSPDLGDYGEQLSDFLAQFEPAASLPYLPDVAHLEWNWHRIFNSKDQPLLDLAALSKVPPGRWPDLVFQLPASSILLTSPYPIHRIWQVNQADASSTETVDLSEGEVNLFLWRDQYETRIDLPNAAEWQLLQAFASGAQFGEICAQLEDRTADIAVTALLPLWVQRGWVTGFTLSLDENENGMG